MTESCETSLILFVTGNGAKYCLLKECSELCLAKYTRIDMGRIIEDFVMDVT